MCDIEPNEPVRFLKCTHEYHVECLDGLLTHQKCDLLDLQCPTCRKTGREINALANDLIVPPPPGIIEDDIWAAMIANGDAIVEDEAILHSSQPDEVMSDEDEAHGSAAGASASSGPAAQPPAAVVEPAPAGVEPAPAGVEAAPAGVEPAPAGVEAAPAGVEPAPAAVEPAPAAAEAVVEAAAEAAVEAVAVAPPTPPLQLAVAQPAPAAGQVILPRPPSPGPTVYVPTSPCPSTSTFTQSSVPAAIKPHKWSVMSGKGSGKAGPPLEDTPTLFCTTCGCPCTLDRCRIINKGIGTFRCLGCCTKITQLYREYGSWPNPQFAAIGEADQVQFYKDIKGIRSCAQLRAFTDDLFEKKNSFETFYEEGGAYLPLSVWDRKGYNTADIITGTAPEDILEHPVLKTCYRLKILSKGCRGSNGWSRSSKIGCTSSKRKFEEAFAKGARHSIVDPPKALADKDAPKADEQNNDDEEKPGSASDSESSSSSSSSSGGKKKDKKKKKKKAKKEKKKKARHAKKEKRDKAKAAKQLKADKATEKANAAKAKTASLISEKVGPAKACLTLLLSRPDANTLPPVVKSRLDEAFKELDAVDAQCKKVVASPGKCDLPEKASSVKDFIN